MRSNRLTKSDTDSVSFCTAWRKSWAATALLPGSKRLRRTSTVLSKDSRSSGCSRLYSCKARPLRWPASCINLSSAVHAFHTLALSSEGSQSSNWHSKSSPVNSLTGGAFPRRGAPECSGRPIAGGRSLGKTVVRRAEGNVGGNRAPEALGVGTDRSGTTSEALVRLASSSAILEVNSSISLSFSVIVSSKATTWAQFILHISSTLPLTLFSSPLNSLTLSSSSSLLFLQLASASSSSATLPSWTDSSPSDPP